MVFDATQPTNVTKIRNLGTVIRPNWTAIQQADATFKPYAVNLDNRTPLPIGNDPVAIANSYIVYSKQDVSGNPQLYGIGPTAQITKITSSIVPVAAASGYTYLPGDLLLQWGKAHASSSATTTVNFPIPYTDLPYSIQVGLTRTSGATGTAQQFYVIDAPLPPTVNRFRVWIDGTGHDFFWMAIGRKV